MLKKLALSSLLLLALPLTIQAKPEGPRDRPEMEEKMFERMQKDLKLTADQSTKIKAIREKYKPKRDAIRAKIDPVHKELMQALMADTPGRAQVESLMRKLSDLRIEARLIEFDQREETMAVLTTEQKKKWRSIMKEHREKMKDRRPPDDD
jgi:Spy/CpxP family protein refolding chaperone